MRAHTNPVHQLQCTEAASLTALAKCAAHCHLPRARAEAARTPWTSPPATDQEEPTLVEHPVQYTPYSFSLPFSAPWPLSYVDGWAQKSAMKRWNTWALFVVLLTEKLTTHAYHYVQTRSVHKCSKGHAHPLHSQDAQAPIGFAGGKGPSRLAVPIVGAKMCSTMTRHSGDALRTHFSNTNACRTGFHNCTCNRLLLRAWNVI